MPDTNRVVIVTGASKAALHELTRTGPGPT